MDHVARAGLLPVAVWECQPGPPPVAVSPAAGELWGIFDEALHRRLRELPITMWTPPIDAAHGGSHNDDGGGNCGGGNNRILYYVTIVVYVFK